MNGDISNLIFPLDKQGAGIKAHNLNLYLFYPPPVLPWPRGRKAQGVGGVRFVPPKYVDKLD